MEISGSVAVVTGGASGLGLATLRKLARAGARVVILDLPASAGQDLRILVHCAGKGGPVRVVDREGNPGSLETYERIVRINLIGTFNMLRLSAARMAANDEVDGERGVCVHDAGRRTRPRQQEDPGRLHRARPVRHSHPPGVGTRQPCRDGAAPDPGWAIPTNTPDWPRTSSRAGCSTENPSGSMAHCEWRLAESACLGAGLTSTPWLGRDIRSDLEQRRHQRRHVVRTTAGQEQHGHQAAHEQVAQLAFRERTTGHQW